MRETRRALTPSRTSLSPVAAMERERESERAREDVHIKNTPIFRPFLRVAVKERESERERERARGRAGERRTERERERER